MARDLQELTGAQREFLLYGPDDRCGDAFDTEAEVEAAWQAHRERLLADYAIGRRPWGWRVFDRPELRWRGYDRERSINWRAGVLTSQEKSQLEALWRRDFQRGRESDIPRELVRRWKKEKPLSEATTEGFQSA